MNVVTGNTATLKHFNDFYYLETLKAAMTMAKAQDSSLSFKHSFAKLESDIDFAFETLCENLAKRIQAYIWTAALGEIRHARSYVSMYIAEVQGGSREDVYNESYKYEPTAENVQAVCNVYNQREWGSTYGGLKWLDIAEALKLYGKVNDATFIDHAVDLEHNGGNIFNKNCESVGWNVCNWDYTTFNMKRFLDYKFSADILNERTFRIDEIEISRKVYNLIVRFSNIVSPVKNLDGYLVPSLEWLSEYNVAWENGTLTTRGKAGTSYTKEQKDKLNASKNVKNVKSTSKNARYIGECQKCGEFKLTDSHSHFDGDCVCERCYLILMANRETPTRECENCGSMVRNTYWIDGEKMNWCEHCKDNYMQTCDVCNYDYHESKVKNIRGRMFCIDCVKIHTCDKCNEVHYHFHRHMIQEHSPLANLNVDGDGIFESTDDYSWIPETEIEVGYSWTGAIFHSYESDAKSADKHIADLKALDARYFYILKIKTFEVATAAGMYKVTMKVYDIPDSGLWVYYMRDAQKQIGETKSKVEGFAIMNNTGYHVQGKIKTCEGLVKAATKMAKLYDWNTLKTIKDVDKIPSIVKSECMKILQY